MAIGDLFPNPDDLKVRGEDEVPGGDISYASDYIDVANHVNDGFTILEDYIKLYFEDIDLVKAWAIAAQSEQVSDVAGEEDYRSSKAYSIACRSMVDDNSSAPVDQKGDVISLQKTAPQYNADFHNTYEDALVLANNTKDQATTAAGKPAVIESDIADALVKLKAIADSRQLIAKPATISKQFLFLENLNETGNGVAATFSRGSSAYRFNPATEKYELVGIDVPRFEGKDGLLLEPAGLNRLYGATCDDWSLTNGSVATPPSGVTNPDGSTINKVYKKNGSDPHITLENTDSFTIYNNYSVCLSVYMTNHNDAEPLKTTIGFKAVGSDGFETMVATYDFSTGETTVSTGISSNERDDLVEMNVVKITENVYRLFVFSRRLLLNDVEPPPSDYPKMWIDVEVGSETDGISFWCPQYELEPYVYGLASSRYKGQAILIGPSSPLPDGFSRSEDKLDIPASELVDLAAASDWLTTPFMEVRLKRQHGGMPSTAPSGDQPSYFMWMYGHNWPYHLDKIEGVRKEYYRFKAGRAPGITIYTDGFSDAEAPVDFDSDDPSDVFQDIQVAFHGHVRNLTIYAGRKYR